MGMGMQADRGLGTGHRNTFGPPISVGTAMFRLPTRRSAQATHPAHPLKRRLDARVAHRWAVHTDLP